MPKYVSMSKSSIISNYCKRGYFHWGKISRKCSQDISCGGKFHDSAPISFIKAYWFYFRVGVIFAKNTKMQITRKLPSRENFHVYSTLKFKNTFPWCITFVVDYSLTCLNRIALGPNFLAGLDRDLD